ncbi:MAG: hypothetical protein ABSB71_10345 [Candidatus Bathyarchaeia archaeon]|jgi:hypothetical protein
MSKKEGTEHELIKARQRRISLLFADAKPSEVTEVYWIYAIRKKETIRSQQPEAENGSSS